MRISTNYQKSNTEDEKTESSFILSAETISNKKVLNLKGIDLLIQPQSKGFNLLKCL